MPEFKIDTYEGVVSFQKEHFSALQGELATLDNFMHDNPDLITSELVERHIMLQIMSTQAASLVNAFLDNLAKK